jgi:hypothetical protein
MRFRGHESRVRGVNFIEIVLHLARGSMRRFIALASLLLLSLSHADATTQEHARATASVAKPTREMIAAAPSVRLAAMVERELSPRGPARLLAPWHPSGAETGIALPAAIAARTAVLPQPASLPVGPVHRLTYDATAPPHLS